MSNDAFGVTVRRAALVLAILVCVGLGGVCLWLQRDLAAKEAEAHRLGAEAEAGAEQVKHLRREIDEIRQLVIGGDVPDGDAPERHEATVVREGNEPLQEADAEERTAPEPPVAPQGQ